MILKKGEYGYIRKKKLRQGIYTGLLFAAALSVFFIGYYLNNQQRNNIFSIIAVLLILPAAKSLVGFIVLLPYTSVDRFKYDRIYRAQKPGMAILVDLVITSSEKVMNLDIIVITNKNVIALLGKENQDINYINTYLERSIKQYQEKYYHVKVFKNYTQFCHRLLELECDESQKTTIEKIEKHILTLAV